MSIIDQNFERWCKTAEEKGLVKKVLNDQMAAHKAMRSNVSALVAKPELLHSRILESFKLGALAGLLAAAAGAALGTPLGLGATGAAMGGYVGLLGGSIKGQADANKEFLQAQGFTPRGVNLLRYAVPNQGAAFGATTFLPEPGFLSV